MTQTTHWNRRAFLSTAGLTVAAAASPRFLTAESTPASATSVACIASANQIQLFHVRGDDWLPLTEATACEAPRSLALHPVHDIVYVAHDTPQYLGLPRASISAWSINHHTGTLLPMSHVPLTLSATHPRHISISPDGRTLLVTATGGGAYNIFSLASDGSILPTAHTLKQTGRGPHPLQSSAQPRTSVFHPTSSIAYACDFGSDRIDQLDLSAEAPSITSRTPLTPGSGPQHIALHPSGTMLITASQLQPTLHLVAIDKNYHHVDTSLQHLSLDFASAGPLCFSPSGDTLYATATTASQASSLFAFQVDHASHRLHQLASSQLPAVGKPQQLLSRGGKLYVAGASGIASFHPNELDHQQVLRKRGITSITMRVV